jgi:NCS1 family nucleobase:cation symporter-1
MGFGSIVEKVLKPLELPERTDVYTWKGTTRWGNHDLYPIPEKERTFGYLGFFSRYVLLT